MQTKEIGFFQIFWQLKMSKPNSKTMLSLLNPVEFRLISM